MCLIEHTRLVRVRARMVDMRFTLDLERHTRVVCGFHACRTRTRYTLRQMGTVYLDAPCHPHMLLNILYTAALTDKVINPWHACAARVTVVGLSVCLSVCLSTTILALQSTRRLMSDTNNFSATRA